MADDEVHDESEPKQPDDDKPPRELTPAERDVKSLAEAVRRMAVPEFELPAYYTINPAQHLSDIVGKQRASIADSIAMASGLANAAVLAQLSGIADVQTKLAAQLIKNTDFGVSASLAQVAHQFAAQQAHAWDSIAASVRLIVPSFYPPNLRDIDGIRLTEVKQVAFIEGVPLYRVPRKETAEVLLQAENLEERQVVLARRWKGIADDCRDAVEACESEAVGRYKSKVLEALDALEAGFPSASQALASSILESLVWDFFGKGRKRFTPGGNRKPEAYDELGAHEFIAFAPIWQAFQRFDTSKGDPVPLTFSRHASVHTISDDQFTRVNALQGLMLASSLVVFMEESQGLDEEAA